MTTDNVLDASSNVQVNLSLKVTLHLTVEADNFYPFFVRVMEQALVESGGSSRKQSCVLKIPLSDGNRNGCQLLEYAINPRN